MPSAVSDANPIAVSTAARARATERGPDTATGGFEALLDIADSAPRPSQSHAATAREPSDSPNARPEEEPPRKAAPAATRQGTREPASPSADDANKQAYPKSDVQADVAATAAASFAQAAAATLSDGSEQAATESPADGDEPAEAQQDTTAVTTTASAVAAVASPVALAALTLATPEGVPGGPVSAIDGTPAMPAAPGQEIAAAVLAAKGVDPKGQAAGLPTGGADGPADAPAQAAGASKPAAPVAAAPPSPTVTDDGASSAQGASADEAGGPISAKDVPYRASTDPITTTTDPSSTAPASSGIPVDQARPLQTALSALGLFGTPLADSTGAQIAAPSAAALANANPLAPVPLAGVAVEIASRALADANTRFDIRLDPPELGRIDVRLDVDRHGHVVSRLVVERAETLDLLRREAGNIERALENAGLKTDANTMQFSLRDQTAGQRQPHETLNANAARLLIRDDQSPDQLPRYSPSIGRPGGLDIRV